jgi:hypothetical protein
MAYRVRERIVRRETIELTNDDYNAIGPGTVLEDCEIIVRAPARDLIINNSKIIGGVWKQKRKLTKKQFSHTHFEDVRFEGSFYDCRFGNHADPSIAGLKNCDFTAATLSFCEFCNVDTADVKTAAWPTVRFEQAQRLAKLIPSLDAPDDFKLVLNVMAQRPDSFSMAVDQAGEIGKKSGLDSDAVRAIIEGLPGVVIQD